MNQSLVSANKSKPIEIWQQLPLNRKIGLGALLTAAITGLIFFFTWAQSPEYSAAFTDLKTEDAAAIVNYLKENNISYEIDGDGSTIRVPTDQVHEVRLALASQGLPGEGSIGMEIFDNANLGMTDFLQQVNYQRALEGELARTISSLTAVNSARVHIVIPQPTLFSEEEEPTTASIVIDLESGQRLGQEQVQAISHLVSSAVEGLTPDNLTIVDMNGNVLADGSVSANTASMALSSSQVDAQRNFERDMELRIESMLRNVLGPDKAVVRVTAKMNWDHVETETEHFFPGAEGGVLRSSRRISETYGGTDDTTGGVPGTATNIPDAAPTFQTEITGTNGSGYQRFDLTTNFEVSRSTSRVISATGQVQQLSVSVMVDNITDTQTINAIEQATVAAAGINPARGDVLTVNSIPFNRTFELEQAAALETAKQREFYLQLAQWGAVAVALIALFFVVRSLLRSVQHHQPEITVENPDPKTALLEEVTKAADPNQVGDGSELGLLGAPTLDADQQLAAEKAQMSRQLQLMAKNRPEAIAQIIQFWLAEDGHKDGQQFRAYG
ncbi:MAG TPA: flagellar basal-body MS-ring/collar protein FliF [Anaerolineae bacterium]|nr:flagellar basal-body MS-ring/collar protein FliF [Anaerolineae bacterium]